MFDKAYKYSKNEKNMVSERYKWFDSNVRNSMSVFNFGEIVNTYIKDYKVDEEDCLSIIYEVNVRNLSEEGIENFAEFIVYNSRPLGAIIAYTMPNQNLVLFHVYQKKSIERLNDRILDIRSSLIEILYEVLNCPGNELN
ncbi:MAG: hypothetical protein Q8Q35_03810 [Nanoarchaeota archaeon]|nr:hypothetical protein [Nanoarchaeota archaeon]